MFAPIQIIIRKYDTTTITPTTKMKGNSQANDKVLPKVPKQMNEKYIKPYGRPFSLPLDIFSSFLFRSLFLI